MNDPAVTQYVVDTWAEALQYAYLCAKGERLGELRGKRSRFLDDRGIHQFSESWGIVTTCEGIEPLLGLSCIATTPWALKRAAQDDALEQFKAECVAESVAA